jgi:MFS transporter, ACS family, glucarate transporter
MRDGQPPEGSSPAEIDGQAIAAGDPPLPVRASILEKPSIVRYSVLAWACSLSMLTYIDRVCIKTVRADMETSLGIDAKDFGLVFGAFGLSYALFEVPSGWLGDRFGPRKVLARIVLWWSFFTVLSGCVWKFSYDLGYMIPIPTALSDWLEPIPLAFNSLVLMVIVRFLFGMGEAGAYPNTARALRNWFPYERRGFAQGLLWAFGRWGGSIAPMLVTLFALPFGWRGAFLAFGIIGVVWVVFFVRYFRNTPAEHPGVNEAERAYIQAKDELIARLPLSWSSMFASPSLWFLCVMYLCSNAGWCFFITWDVQYYKSVLHLEGTELLIAEGLPLFFGGIACLTGGFLTDRQVRVWGRRWGRTAQGCFAYALGGTFFLLALALRDYKFASVACLCVASFGKDFAMAVSWSTCLDIGHRYAGTVSGFMNGIGNLGTALAPPIIGYFAHTRGDWGLALTFSASLFFTASVCWLFINPRKVIVYEPDDHASLRAQGILE